MKTIRYIPTAELLLFFTGCLLSTLLYIKMEFPVVILFLSFLAAFLPLAIGANFIKIENGELIITYWYVIFWTERVVISDIVRIQSQETFRQEGGIDTFRYALRRSYLIEFKDKKDRIKKLQFKIGNRQKETEIVTHIMNACQPGG